MQVILLEQVKKLGNVGQVVEVRGGYARNFLLPNNKALRATQENIAVFESKKADLEKQNQERVEAAKKLLAKVDGKLASVISQAGEDGRLYGSITAASIAEAVRDQLKVKEVERTQIVLNNPIKYIGVHAIEVELHPQVIATLNVNVARSQGDAENAAARFAKGERVMEGPEAEMARRAAAAEAESALPQAAEAKAEEVAPVAEGEAATAEAAPKKKKSKKADAEDAAA